MSADAKIWTDDEGCWRWVHDGPCRHEHPDLMTPYGLCAVIKSIEACMGYRMRWEFRIYPDGNAGLVGYVG